jgi:hypothetical protein
MAEVDEKALTDAINVYASKTGVTCHEAMRAAITAYLAALPDEAQALGDEAAVERVARAIYEATIPKGGKNYCAYDDLATNDYYDTLDRMERYARAAISAMHGAPDANR